MAPTRLSKIVAFALSAAALLPLEGSAARAGGFYLAERGARAFSLGGAHIAGADDLNAQWLNPAGLTRLRGNHHLYFDAALIGADQRFARAHDPEVSRRDPAYTDGFPVARSTGEPFFDPSLAYATRLGLEDWIFAVGVYGPYAGTNRWDRDGPQRYSLISLEPIKLTAQFSVAWQPHPRLSVGVGLQLIYASIRQRVAISGYPGVFGWAEDRELDVLAEVQMDNTITPSGNAGIIWTPVDGFDIGASGQLPVRTSLRGTLSAHLPTHHYFSESRITGDRLSGQLDFPAILRLGLRVYDADIWSLELATVAEFWSIMRSLPITPDGIAFENVPGIGTFGVRPIAVRQDLQDVFSVRLGGSYRPLDGPVTLRAGTYFETGAAPDETLSVLRIDGNKIGLALGATLHLDPIALDFAGGYVHMLPRTVTTSESYQINPLYDVDEAPFGPSGPSIVGNGRYELSHWVVAMTMHASW